MDSLSYIDTGLANMKSSGLAFVVTSTLTAYLTLYANLSTPKPQAAYYCSASGDEYAYSIPQPYATLVH